MNFLGDYFAVAFTIVLLIFYLDKQTRLRMMPKDSQLFLGCLLFTAINALVNIVSGLLLELEGVPLWLNMAVNACYFVTNIMATSCIALFLFTKILSHSYENCCMKYAKTGLSILFGVYMVAVVANFWTGWLFYFDQAGNYCRGPINGIGYVVVLCQMALVMMCFFRNRKIASRPLYRILSLSFPGVVVFILVQQMYPDIMLNGIIMTMMDAVLFLTFQGQQQGIHSLTKLNDRRRFFQEAERRMEHKVPFRTYLINLKNLSAINRKYGHIFGDEFLYQFAFALEKLFADAVAYHMNGTVFALILPARFASDEEKRTGQLLHFLDSGFECMQKHVDVEYVLVEYAVNQATSSAAEFYERLEYAAARAYEEKCQYIRYTEDMGEQMNRERYLLERLRNVTRENGFMVWFQPIQYLETQRFASMEALIRLREPDGTMVSPGEFIPLAEETGRINAVTWFVLEEVCQFLQAEQTLEDVSVSVNIPMAQLLEKGFITRLNSIVDRAGVAHHRICLEFTERAILETFIQIKGVMDLLTADGYRFYLDDFGAGYSNFNCLYQLPIQIIKLDTCLLRSSQAKKDGYTTAKTLTDLFHQMGLQVVAEGVETEEEVEILRNHGVDWIQGFALARPMPVEKLLDFYSERKFM